MDKEEKHYIALTLEGNTANALASVSVFRS